jgi:hypothetical protein
MREFWDAMKLDLNPPLNYLIARWCINLFGKNEFATRLPSMLGFLLGSICVYRFTSIRLPRVFGLLAVLVLWTSPYLTFASEARPYALVIGFLGLAMVSWQRSLETPASVRALVTLCLALCCLMLSHLFGVFYTVPFFVAELLLWLRTKKHRIGVWCCLVLPYVIPAIYISKAKAYEKDSIAQAFQASLHKIVGFYAESLGGHSAALLVATVVGLTVVFGYRRLESFAGGRFSVPEVGMALTFLVLPVYMNVVLMRSHSGFFPRYALPVIIAYSLLFVMFIARAGRRSESAALIVSLVLMVFLFRATLLDAVVGLKYGDPFLSIPQKTSDPCRTLKPELPLVAASGLTFIEMDHYAGPTTAGRLHYLTDRELAIRYAGATIFEGLPSAKKHFPIRGTVEPYKKFVSEHDHFLVVGTPDYPEDWLISELLTSHADMRFLGTFPNNYKDWHVFEVTMPAHF